MTVLGLYLGGSIWCASVRLRELSGSFSGLLLVHVPLSQVMENMSRIDDLLIFNLFRVGAIFHQKCLQSYYLS